MTDRQPPLPLAWPARRGPQDFFVSDSNRAAVAWLAEPARWPMPRCLLIGPAAAGKSHLAGLFAARHGGTVIEDADRLADGEPLFHAWNAATPAVPLLLTARALPRQWAHALPDLASRLAATPVARLDDPDDTLLHAVLVKQFGERGLKVAPEVIAWLVLRLERSLAAVAEAVALVDAAALAQRREITIPLARDVLEAQGRLAL